VVRKEQAHQFFAESAGRINERGPKKTRISGRRQKIPYHVTSGDVTAKEGKKEGFGGGRGLGGDKIPLYTERPKTGWASLLSHGTIISLVGNSLYDGTTRGGRLG